MRKLIAAALTVGWVVSLMLPVAVMGNGPDEVWPGFAVLIVGPLGVLVTQFAWFAAALEAAARHLGLPAGGADSVAGFLRVAPAAWAERWRTAV